MKHIIYAKILFGIVALYSCSNYAMESNGSGMNKYYSKFGQLQMHEYDKLKPQQIEQRINFLLTLPSSSAQQQEINKLMNKLQAQAPGAADRLRERVQSSEEKKKLVEQVELFEFVGKARGITKQQLEIHKDEQVRYKLFKENIPNITATIKDIASYYDKNKITYEVAAKLAGNVNGGVTQKIADLQQYLIEQAKYLALKISPIGLTFMKFLFNMPENATEKANFKTALIAWYKAAESSASAISNLSITNPVGIHLNNEIVKDFTLDPSTGVLEQMKAVIEIGRPEGTGVFTEKEVEQMQNSFNEYLKNIALGLQGQKPKKD